MTGFDASSAERCSGRVGFKVNLADDQDDTAIALVTSRIQSFVMAIKAGFFFPGTLRSPLADVVRTSRTSLQCQIEVVDLEAASFAVLGGVLADCRYQGVDFRSAYVVVDSDRRDILVETELRPVATKCPPFKVELPADQGGNYALLVEIVFGNPVASGIRQKLLDELALWDVLSLAYPIDPDEPVEISGAQQHFNDPRTIHHHEWVWDNVDPSAWSLLVNLCCAWSCTLPVVRLHVE